MSSVNPGLVNKQGDKSKNKYKSIDINNVYKGTSTTTQRATGARQHGLQSLGKVASARRMPPPVHLPSLKSENCGTDPNVTLVPSGGAGWGSKEEEKIVINQSTGTNLKSGSVESSRLSAVAAGGGASGAGGGTAAAVESSNGAAGTGSAAGGNLLWSNLTAGSKTIGKVGRGKAFHDEEFPELAVAASTEETTSTQQTKKEKEQKEAQYGPGPSLRPQNVASWREGGGKSIKQQDVDNALDDNSDDLSQRPNPSTPPHRPRRSSSSSDDEAPQPATPVSRQPSAHSVISPGQYLPPHMGPFDPSHMQAMPPRMMHPGMGPPRPMGPMIFGGPPPPPHMIPPFMFRGRPGFPPRGMYPPNFIPPGAFYHPHDPRFRGMMPPPHMGPPRPRPALDADEDERSSRSRVVERSAIIKDEALREFDDRLEAADGGWAADLELDYSRKIVFSDDEDEQVQSSDTKHQRSARLSSSNEDRVMSYDNKTTRQSSSRKDSERDVRPAVQQKFSGDSDYTSDRRGEQLNRQWSRESGGGGRRDYGGQGRGGRYVREEGEGFDVKRGAESKRDHDQNWDSMYYQRDERQYNQYQGYSRTSRGVEDKENDSWSGHHGGERISGLHGDERINDYHDNKKTSRHGDEKISIYHGERKISGDQKTSSYHGDQKTSGYYGDQKSSDYQGDQKSSSYHGEQKSSGYHGEQKTTGYYGEQKSSGYHGDQKTNSYRGDQKNSSYHADEKVNAYHGDERMGGYHGDDRTSGYHGDDRSSGYYGDERGNDTTRSSDTRRSNGRTDERSMVKLTSSKNRVQESTDTTQPSILSRVDSNEKTHQQEQQKTSADITGTDDSQKSVAWGSKKSWASDTNVTNVESQVEKVKSSESVRSETIEKSSADITNGIERDQSSTYSKHSSDSYGNGGYNQRNLDKDSSHSAVIVSSNQKSVSDVRALNNAAPSTSITEEKNRSSIISVDKTQDDNTGRTSSSDNKSRLIETDQKDLDDQVFTETSQSEDLKSNSRSNQRSRQDVRHNYPPPIPLHQSKQSGAKSSNYTPLKRSTESNSVTNIVPEPVTTEVKEEVQKKVEQKEHRSNLQQNTEEKSLQNGTRSSSGTNVWNTSRTTEEKGKSSGGGGAPRRPTWGEEVEEDDAGRQKSRQSQGRERGSNQQRSSNREYRDSYNDKDPYHGREGGNRYGGNTREYNKVDDRPPMKKKRDDVSKTSESSYDARNRDDRRGVGARRGVGQRGGRVEHGRGVREERAPRLSKSRPSGSSEHKDSHGNTEGIVIESNVWVNKSLASENIALESSSSNAWKQNISGPTTGATPVERNIKPLMGSLKLQSTSEPVSERSLNHDVENVTVAASSESIIKEKEATNEKQDNNQLLESEARIGQSSAPPTENYWVKRAAENVSNQPTKHRDIPPLLSKEDVAELNMRQKNAEHDSLDKRKRGGGDRTRKRGPSDVEGWVQQDEGEYRKRGEGRSVGRGGSRTGRGNYEIWNEGESGGRGRGGSRKRGGRGGYESGGYRSQDVRRHRESGEYKAVDDATRHNGDENGEEIMNKSNNEETRVRHERVVAPRLRGVGEARGRGYGTYRSNRYSHTGTGSTSSRGKGEEGYEDYNEGYERNGEERGSRGRRSRGTNRKRIGGHREFVSSSHSKLSSHSGEGSYRHGAGSRSEVTAAQARLESTGARHGSPRATVSDQNSDLGNEEWATASESSDVLLHEVEEVKGEGRRRAGEGSHTEQRTGYRRQRGDGKTGAEKSVRGDGVTSSSRTGGTFVRGGSGGSAKSGSGRSVNNRSTSAGDKSKSAVEETAEAKQARAERERKEALQNIDINNYAGVVVIDDQPEVSIDDPIFLYDPNDGFQEVTSKRDKKSKQKAAAQEEAQRKTDQERSASLKKADKENKAGSGGSGAENKRSGSVSKVNIPRFAKQQLRDNKDKKHSKSSTQPPGASVVDDVESDVLPKIENWNNDMANDIPGRRSARSSQSTGRDRVSCAPSTIGTWEQMSADVSAAAADTAVPKALVAAVAAASIGAAAVSTSARSASADKKYIAEEAITQPQQPQLPQQPLVQASVVVGAERNELSAIADDSRAVKKPDSKPFIIHSSSGTIKTTSYTPFSYTQGADTLKFEFDSDAAMKRSGEQQLDVHIQQQSQQISADVAAGIASTAAVSEMSRAITSAIGGHRSAAASASKVDHLAPGGSTSTGSAHDLNRKIESAKSAWDNSVHKQQPSSLSRMVFEQAGPGQPGGPRLSLTGSTIGDVPGITQQHQKHQSFSGALPDSYAVSSPKQLSQSYVPSQFQHPGVPQPDVSSYGGVPAQSFGSASLEDKNEHVYSDGSVNGVTQQGYRVATDHSNPVESTSDMDNVYQKPLSSNQQQQPYNISSVEEKVIEAANVTSAPASHQHEYTQAVTERQVVDQTIYSHHRTEPQLDQMVSSVSALSEEQKASLVGYSSLPDAHTQMMLSQYSDQALYMTGAKDVSRTAMPHYSAESANVCMVRPQMQTSSSSPTSRPVGLATPPALGPSGAQLLYSHNAHQASQYPYPIGASQLLSQDSLPLAVQYGQYGYNLTPTAVTQAGPMLTQLAVGSSGSQANLFLPAAALPSYHTDLYNTSTQQQQLQLQLQQQLQQQQQQQQLQQQLQQQQQAYRNSVLAMNAAVGGASASSASSLMSSTAVKGSSQQHPYLSGGSGQQQQKSAQLSAVQYGQLINNMPQQASQSVQQIAQQLCIPYEAAGQSGTAGLSVEQLGAQSNTQIIGSPIVGAVGSHLLPARNTVQTLASSFYTQSVLQQAAGFYQTQQPSSATLQGAYQQLANQQQQQQLQQPQYGQSYIPAAPSAVPVQPIAAVPSHSQLKLTAPAFKPSAAVAAAAATQQLTPSANALQSKPVAPGLGVAAGASSGLSGPAALSLQSYQTGNKTQQYQQLYQQQQQRSTQIYNPTAAVGSNPAAVGAPASDPQQLVRSSKPAQQLYSAQQLQQQQLQEHLQQQLQQQNSKTGRVVSTGIASSTAVTATTSSSVNITQAVSSTLIGGSKEWVSSSAAGQLNKQNAVSHTEATNPSSFTGQDIKSNTEDILKASLTGTSRPVAQPSRSLTTVAGPANPMMSRSGVSVGSSYTAGGRAGGMYQPPQHGGNHFPHQSYPHGGPAAAPPQYSQQKSIEEIKELQKQERQKALADVASFLNPHNKPPAKTLLKNPQPGGASGATDDA